MTDRRAFLASLPLLSVLKSSAAQTTPIVDTHLHCFAGAKDARFPYHKDAPYQPAESATPEHLLQCMADANVDRAIVVHPEPYQDDHRYLEHCLTVGRGRLQGTCLFFADRANSIEAMRRLAKSQPIVAVRIHAYNPERLPPFEQPELKRFWRTAGELGLAIQLHFEPRYAGGFEQLIRDHSKVTVLVDHMGRPFQGTEKEYQVVLGWAKFPNVVVKLSSVPDRLKYPHRDPGKVIRQLTDRFGAERLMYGGGYSAGATGKSYASERERVRGFLAHLPEAEQHKIFGETAVKIFKPT